MRPHRIFALLAPLWVAVVLSGCKPRGAAAPFDPNDPAKAAEALRRHLKAHPDDDAAWRDLAHIQWIHLEQGDEGLQTLDRLAGKGDPTALLSTMLAAEARMQPAVMQARAESIITAATQASAEADDRAFLMAAAEVAGRTLNKIHGDLPDHDTHFAAFFDQLSLAGLPARVTQPLISLRASIARRRSEPYAAWFQQQGCVQKWEASTLHGTLGDYELTRLDRSKFVADPQAQVIPLSCVTRVWNPHPRAGVRRLRTTLTAPGDTLELDVSAQEALAVFVDGVEVHRTDRTDRYPQRRRRLRVDVSAGPHELEVAMAVNSARAWLLVRAVDGNGAPLTASAGAPPNPGKVEGAPHSVEVDWIGLKGSGLNSGLYKPLRAALAVEGALAVGNADLAERLAPVLRRASHFAEGALVRARFERSDPSRSATMSASREQAALERAIELRPDLDSARLRLLELMLDRGDDAQALDTIESLESPRLAGVRGELLRHRIYRARGNEHMAAAALERARVVNPKDCKVLIAQRAEARERDNVRREDELAGELESCSGSLDIRARLAETRSRLGEAEELWSEALARVPDDIEALEGLARIATIRDDVAAAKQHLSRVLELSPARVGANVALADLALLQGDEDTAHAQVARALARVPYADQLHKLGQSLGIEDDLMAFRVDGTEALARYKASGQTYEGVSEVLVLDRSVARVYEGGGLRQIVHIVVHLLGKEALDNYGELDLPQGARILTLRSIKADGTVVDPELIPGKDGVSLRHLEVGDFVEYEFVIQQEPASAMPEYIDVSTFRFQSLDVPYHRSELHVVHPASIAFEVDRRNGPPAGESATKVVAGKQLTVLSFVADEVPRLGVEPGARALIDEVPNVRVYTPLDVEGWLHSLAANVRYTTRANPELRRKVQRLTAGKKSKRSKVRALWSWVSENVEDAGDLSSPATATLASKTGNRLMLLRAMFDVAGIDSELWLARNKFGPKPLPGGHPMVEGHDAAMLAVDLDDSGELTMVMAASEVMPLGYLVTGYGGSDAYRVPMVDGDVPAKLKVPDSPARLADRRRWDLDIALEASGRAAVSGTITLGGGEAIVWRQALHDVDRDRIEDVFLQAELPWLRGATVESLDIEGERDLDAPLVLQFEASTDALGIVQDGALVLPSDLVPLNLGARYVTLPRRVTGLVIPYAPVHEARISYTLSGARFAEVPPSARFETPRGSFTRTVSGTAGADALVIEHASKIEPGVVDPIAYEALADFARRVETTTSAVLRAR